MKNIKLLLMLIICIFIFVNQDLNAQDKSTYKKISEVEAPEKVKNAFNSIKGYKIKEIAIDTKKNSSSSTKIYLVTLYKGEMTQKYLVNSKGKILEMLE